MIRTVVSTLLLLVVTACHDPEAYILGPDRIDDVLAITLSAATMPADGIARISIVAQLDPRTDADKRKVTFTTTNGTLIGGGKRGPEVSVDADTTGRAIAELLSSTTPGTATLQVAVGSVSQSTSVELLAVSTEDLYDVTVSQFAIPADGFSTARITVTLKRLGTPQQRIVKFDASAGTLIGAGVTTPPRTANVTADANGIASIELQSEKGLGTARLAITALDSTREIGIQFVPVDPSHIITLSVAPSTATADNTTPISVIARVTPGLPPGRRTVTFRTTVGRFLPGGSDSFQIEADGSNTARATLVSALTGVPLVTATIDGTTASATAEFTLARPDRLFVSVSSAELKPGESVQVAVTLLRNTGTPNPRQEVTYMALTPAGVLVGAFSGATLSNEVGESRATFNVGMTSYVGPLTIRASVGGVSGAAVVQIVQ